MSRKPYTRSRVDPESYVRGQAGVSDADVHNRANLQGLKLLDLRFEDLMAPLEPLVSRVYQFCGVDLSAASLQHKQGRHTYALQARLFGGSV